MTTKPVAIRKHQLVDITGLSPQTCGRLEREGKFPRRRRLADGSIGWLYCEIEEWARALPISDLGLRGEKREAA
jgi:predicted DNA-binding transcriptional regulator AlpA